jgi:hypothetical protein
MDERWIERHRLPVYYALSLVIAVGVMTVSVLLPGPPDVLGGLRAYLHREHLITGALGIIRYASTEEPLAWLILVFAGAPALAALAVSAWIGRGALGTLIRRFLPWQSPAARSRALRFYLTWGVISGAVMVWYYWMGSRHGTPEQLAFRDAALGTSPLAVAAWLLASHLFDEGGTFEELGWRGFALPVLLERFGSPLRASVVLGTIWMAWHLPREIPGLLSGQPVLPFIEGQLVFLLLTIALSVLCTYGYLETGGSVLPAIVIHGGSNVWSKALGEPLYPYFSGPVDPRTVIVVALAVLVVAMGRLRGTRSGLTPNPV